MTVVSLPDTVLKSPARNIPCTTCLPRKFHPMPLALLQTPVPCCHFDQSLRLRIPAPPSVYSKGATTARRTWHKKLLLRKEQGGTRYPEHLARRRKSILKAVSKRNCNHRGAFDLDFALLSHPAGMALAGTFRAASRSCRTQEALNPSELNLEGSCACVCKTQQDAWN